MKKISIYGYDDGSFAVVDESVQAAADEGGGDLQSADEALDQARAMLSSGEDGMLSDEELEQRAFQGSFESGDEGL